MCTKSVGIKTQIFFSQYISVLNMIVKINSKCFSKQFKNILLFIMGAGCVCSELCDCVFVRLVHRVAKKKTISVIDLS